jgi:peptidoglycan hydrolase-like protein with peptidoglycan-binding domain
MQGGTRNCTARTMICRIVIAIAVALLGGGAAAQDSTDFIKRVQEKLNALGFNAGPVNGDFGPQMQAALARFQLSRTLPASGQLDAQTLLELGEARDATASEGATAEPRGDSRASPENPDAKGG